MKDINRKYLKYGLSYRTANFCNEDFAKVKNFDKALKDNFKGWNCHHKREISEMKSAEQLKKEDLYFYRPAKELIFLTRSEHTKLHNKYKREETIVKLKQSMKSNENDGLVRAVKYRAIFFIKNGNWKPSKKEVCEYSYKSNRDNKKLVYKGYLRYCSESKFYKLVLAKIEELIN